jgi:hypothetical protein
MAFSLVAVAVGSLLLRRRGIGHDITVPAA